MSRKFSHEPLKELMVFRFHFSKAYFLAQLELFHLTSEIDDTAMHPGANKPSPMALARP